MASRIVEFFGFDPQDSSERAKAARQNRTCPFLGTGCLKTLSDGQISGACTLEPKSGGPVICCPIRLYAGNYQILHDIAQIAFGSQLPLVSANSITERSGECIGVSGKHWGKELRLPNRGKRGGYFVDWVLAHVDSAGVLVSFVAIEVSRSIRRATTARA